MTISSQDSRNDYTGSGSTTAFAFTFIATASTDVKVYVNDALQTSGYSVSGTFPGTGTVTFTTAPTSGAHVALVRDTPYTQGFDVTANTTLPEGDLEKALDRGTILAQQAKAIAQRAWRFIAGSPFAEEGYELPTPKALTYPRVTSDCSGIEFVSLTATGTYVDPVSTQGDMIVGGTTGVQERLPLPSTNGVILYRDPDTNRPGWKPGLAVSLTNKGDAATGTGCVLMLALNCDRAAVINDIKGCTGVFVVSPAAIGDDCEALWTVSGLIRGVMALGAITRGDYLRKSATGRALESTGVQAGEASAPIGSLGIAVTAESAGAVDAYLFGHTVTSRVQGTCGKFAKFGTSCTASDSVITEGDNDVTSTLPLVLPAVAGTPRQNTLYRESPIRAWVTFSGSSATAGASSPSAANAIGACVAYNITGGPGTPETPIVTKLATGTFCVSFRRVFSCASYVLWGSGSAVGGAAVIVQPIDVNAECCAFTTRNNGNVLVNPENVLVAFVGFQ